MPLYVADYLADTRRLSTLEHGAYMLLIMDYWRNGGLPDDDRKLARIVGLSEAEWMDIRDTIADLFQADWKHKRIDEELAKSEAKTERRVEAGRRGGLAKAANKPSNATILPEQTPSNALASSSQPQSHTTSVVCTREADFRSAIASEYTRAGFLPPDTGRAVIWLQNGWQQSICVEAVRAGLARKGKQLPLNYFEGQIADAHAPVPIGSPNQRAGPSSGEKPPSLATQILQRAAQNERNRTESQPIVIDAFPVARGAG